MTHSQTTAPLLGLTSAADVRAARCWAANLRSLAETQPALVGEVQSVPCMAEWVLARDGALTGRQDGRWHSGCSVPNLAAEKMLEKLSVRGNVGCFLSPTHAAQVRVALDKLRREQAILAIVPDMHVLRILLQCDDFSAEIAQHRLWFAWGQGWAERLAQLLDERPGMPTPTQFIRLPILPDEQAQQLIETAQRLFGMQNQANAARLSKLNQRWRPAPLVRRVCVAAPSLFRLWDDAGDTLARSLRESGFEVVAFDPDDPAAASPVGMATCAAECDAFVAVDKGRADLPNVLPAAMPWVTWVTGGQIPPAAGAGPSDRVVVADERWRALAIQAGWQDGRVSCGAWPARATQAGGSTGDGRQGGAHLLVVADTREVRLDEPFDLSSHQLLWQAIANELKANPFAVGEDVGHYLDAGMARMGTASQGLDRRKFIEELIVPAYQQSLVRTLVEAGVAVRLAGWGWSDVTDLAALSLGPVTSREQLGQLAGDAAALLHVWPWLHAHPIDAMGRAVIRRSGRRKESWVRDAQLALRGDGVHPVVGKPDLATAMRAALA